MYIIDGGLIQKPNIFCGSLSVFPENLKQRQSSALPHLPVAIERNMTGPNDSLSLIRQRVYVQTDIFWDDPIEEYISPLLIFETPRRIVAAFVEVWERTRGLPDTRRSKSLT